VRAYQAGESEQPPENRRLITLALLRSLAISAVLVALYYLLPLDHLKTLPTGIPLITGLVILAAVTVWQIRAIVSASHPAVRAVEALAVTAPTFLLLFAADYFLMSQHDPATFTQQLTRSDALYFTVSTFSTVGFGDITPVGQYARLVVTAQMILDLLILGLGVRVFIGAVQLGRRHPGPAARPSPLPHDLPAPPDLTAPRDLPV
jgi:voltage-gated potassium channel